MTGQGLRATLAEATFETAGTRISTPVAAHDIPTVQRRVDAALTKVCGHVPVTTTMSARGDSYAVPGQEHTPASGPGRSTPTWTCTAGTPTR